MIQKSAALALAAERAAEKLRQSGLKELFSEERASPASSARASKAHGPPAPPGFTPQRAAPKTAASALAHHHEHSEPLEATNPTLTAILEYSRLSSLALRQLAIYLEQGPRGTRAEALRELVRLGHEAPRWKNLESLAREARLTETDPELQRDLDKLVAYMRAERGG